jgi:ribose 5-phosphate isomerase A
MEKIINNITGVVTVGIFAMRPADVVLIGKGTEVATF